MKLRARHVGLVIALVALLCVLAFTVWVYIVSYVGVHGGI